MAESRSNAVFGQVYSHWSRPNVYLISLSNDLDAGRSADFVQKVKSNSFSEHLRDFSTICQALVRIAPILDPNSPDVGSEVNSCC